MYYNYNYSVAADLGYEAVMADPSLVPGDNTTIACSKRFFDDGYHTIVTEVLSYIILIHFLCRVELLISFILATTVCLSKNSSNFQNLIFSGIWFAKTFGYQQPPFLRLK